MAPSGLSAKTGNDSMDTCAVLVEVGYFRSEGNKAEARTEELQEHNS